MAFTADRRELARAKTQTVVKVGIRRVNSKGYANAHLELTGINPRNAKRLKKIFFGALGLLRRAV